MDARRGTASQNDEGCAEQLGRNSEGKERLVEVKIPSNRPEDLPQQNRRKREKALVQGMFATGGEGSLPKRLITLQDMHYADFAEDEVRLIMVMKQISC